MLLITMVVGKDVEWHVRDKGPFERETWEKAHDVMEVQADGHELEWIQENLGIARDITVRGVRFFGDQAQFIAANLSDGLLERWKD